MRENEAASATRIVCSGFSNAVLCLSHLVAASGCAFLARRLRVRLLVAPHALAVLFACFVRQWLVFSLCVGVAQVHIGRENAAEPSCI
jgi:hypothetical protein